MFIALIIFLVILGFVAYLLTMAPIDASFKGIIHAVLVLIAILACTDAIGLTHFGVLTWIPVGR